MNSLLIIYLFILVMSCFLLIHVFPPKNIPITFLRSPNKHYWHYLQAQISSLTERSDVCTILTLMSLSIFSSNSKYIFLNSISVKFKPVNTTLSLQESKLSILNTHTKKLKKNEHIKENTCGNVVKSIHNRINRKSHAGSLVI